MALDPTVGYKIPVSPSVNTPAATPAPTPAPSPSSSQSAQPTSYGPYGNDPGFIAAQSAAEQQKAQAAAFYNQQAQAAQYQFSGAGNPYSTVAQLQQQHTDSTRAYLNYLASHGILASGETGYQAGQEAKRYGAATYNAQNALAALLGGYRQNFLTANSGADDLLTNALVTANQNYQSQLKTGDPGIYGYWNNGYLPNGQAGWVPVNPNDPYQSQKTGGSLVVQYLK